MTEAVSRTAPADSTEDVVSPGLAANREFGPAYELKFRLTVAEAERIEAWAQQHLTPDPHGLNGAYHTTSVYCDTAAFDMFHRSSGYRRSKFRMRRYGTTPLVFLERKTKWGDRVEKKRAVVAPEEIGLLATAGTPLTWEGAWFQQRLLLKALRPTCRVGYLRTAFFGSSAGTPVRLTLDRQLIGVPARDWEVAPLENGLPLLPGGVLLELKFHAHLPPLFRDVLGELPAQPARVSKYRRCVELCGLLPSSGHDIARIA